MFEPITRINYFVKKYGCNVLRMDLEGYEYEILKQNIPNKVNKIALELHTDILGKHKTMKLLKSLDNQNFKVQILIEDLPLRLYPFFRILKGLRILKFFTSKIEDENIDEIEGYIFKGRNIKYLLLTRK